MVKIALIGANGRLGTAIQKLATDERFSKTIEITPIGHGNDGKFLDNSENFSVALDVSQAAAGEGYIKALQKKNSKLPYIVGSTGWSESQYKVLETYSRLACVVIAPNFSPAVNLLYSLLDQCSPLLAKWGYNVAVHDIHHVHKKDSPSGTAKAIVEHLHDLKPQVHSSRLGGVVGIHEVKFAGPHDVLTLTHEAFDRSIFAYGALLAAQWAFANKTTSGLFSMKDVLIDRPSNL
jgi:4-hydroxy-tetrahydrodipicolinate reductase